MAAYQVYYVAFERRDDQSLRGLSFFFGLLFITEVALVLTFGVDYRTVQANYIGPSISLGLFDLPLRLLVPFLVAMAMVIGLRSSSCRVPSSAAPSRRSPRTRARCG